MKRRVFLKSSTATAASLSLAGAGSALAQNDEKNSAGAAHPILLSCKWGMIGGKASVAEKMTMLKELGYDGVELDSPGGANKKEALAASKETGLPIHGVVDSIHWKTRLSDPDAAVREKGLQGLLTAIRDSNAVGGSSVLLVPGRVANEETENHDQVWKRSIEQINKALPLAAKLGVHILIENVWNGFLYKHKGADNQSADLLCKYLDEIDSPWVGSYFDIGNHQKYCKPADWIRTLGKRIVKLDVKDWGKKTNFSKIGDGDVDWADVRKALKEIKFTGWATAEVGGGPKERLADVLARMRKNVLGVGA